MLLDLRNNMFRRKTTGQHAVPRLPDITTTVKHNMYVYVWINIDITMGPISFL
jgi:hypothetical protein